ncbi:MAG: non-ribosomal peptide synthetase, partial [Blastocatellia bacterium]
SYPRKRLRFVVKDAQTHVILTGRRFAFQLGEQYITVLFADDCDDDCDESERSGKTGSSDLENYAGKAEAGDVLSIIYTSGSTGVPKGVLESHDGFLNRFRWMWSRFPFDSNDVCSQKTSIGFVDSIWEIFGPLLSGVKTVIIPDSTVRDAEELVATLNREQVTRIVVVPALLGAILDIKPFPREGLKALKYCFSSGEALLPVLARRFSTAMPQCALINLYGSSEVAADVTWCDAREGLTPSSVLIGRPLDNVRVYLLDSRMQPVPVGVPGAIYCGGVQLAYGYLNRPDLTAVRFLPDLFADSPGYRLFQTGDIGRFLPDGGIEYLGRADRQIKLRGFRIELGEIEAALSEHRQVRSAIIRAQDDDARGAKLIGYISTENEDRPTPEGLRQFLSKRLPDYMLPSAFVFLDAFPLTPSGKVDIRSLPEPSRASAIEAGPKPDGLVPEMIAGMWTQLLNVERIGPDDDFFELGGHSLLATQLQSRLRNAFKIELPLGRIFESPRLAGMAAVVEGLLRDNQGFQYSSIEPAFRGRHLPLSYAQERQ